jgi:hypothetical protein
MVRKEWLQVRGGTCKIKKLKLVALSGAVVSINARPGSGNLAVDADGQVASGTEYH